MDVTVESGCGCGLHFHGPRRPTGQRNEQEYEESRN
jgi:hypothetical protein